MSVYAEPHVTVSVAVVDDGVVTVSSGNPVGTDPNAISKAIVSAKGDLIAASGSGAPVRLAAGTNGFVLTADSAQTLGVKWSSPVTGSPTVYNALDYGTANTGAAIQAAVNAATTNGGVVFVPPGTWNFTTTLTMKENVILQGAGMNATHLHFTEQGSGHYAIDGRNHGIQNTAHHYRDLHVVGPASGTLGTSPCAMDGVRLCPNATMTNCMVNYLHAGVVCDADHQILTGCKISNNYWNVDFPDGPYSKGNHNFFACDLVAPYLASVHVGGDNIIDAATFVGCHVGWGPYGFLKEDKLDATPSTAGFFNETLLHNVSFEYIGNGSILDLSTGSGAGQTTFALEIHNPGFSYGSSSNIGALSKAWNVTLRVTIGVHIYQGVYPFTSLTGGVGGITAVDATGITIHDAIGTNQFGNGTAAGNAVGAIIKDIPGKGAFGTLDGIVRTAAASVSANALLEWNGAQVQTLGTSTGAYAGVAGNTTVAGGMVMVFQTTPATLSKPVMNMTFPRDGTLTATAGVKRIPMPINGVITGVRATVNTAPTTSSIICDVNKNGTTIFTTQGNRPTIAATAFATTSCPRPDVASFSAGDYFTVDVDQIGSGVAGSDLIVQVSYIAAN